MATSASLRSLSVFGEVFWNCYTHRLSSLVEVTLALLTDVEYLKAVFTHLPQLRSLTLLAGAAQYGDLAVILRTYYDALPLLTAFRLSCTTMGKDVAEAVAKFLGTKPLLERLELGYHWDMCTFEDAEPVLEILPRLPRLRAFGAELCGSSWMAPAPTPAHLLSLSQYIPRQLTALSLWVVLDTESTTTETDWIQFFHGLRSCRFLYISTDPVYPGMPGIEELKRTFFDHPPPSVELVGFNEDLRWVEREAETGLVEYSESWPLSRVYYRTVEDFGCEEWEWLLRQVDLRLL